MERVALSKMDDGLKNAILHGERVEFDVVLNAETVHVVGYVVGQTFHIFSSEAKPKENSNA